VRKRKRSQGSVDITSFFSPEPPPERSREPELKPGEAPQPDVESRVAELIISRGRVRKSAIYQWSKEAGVPPAVLYRALVSLERKGVVRRVFDEEVEELVYVAVGGGEPQY